MDEQFFTQDDDLKSNKLWKYVQKVKKRISTNPSKILSVVATIAVVLAIPVTVLVSQQRQNLKQRASELETKEYIFNGYQGLPYSSIGIDKTNTFMSPSIALGGNGQRIYVFVIGDGPTFKDGSSTGRSIYESYRLYETHSDNGGTTWSDFSDLEGILSTPITYKNENGSLYIYAFGWDLTDPNNPKSGYDTDSRVNIYSRKETNGSFSAWETVNPVDPRYTSAGDPRYYIRNTLTTNGVQFTVSPTEDGRLKIIRVPQGSNSNPPTASPTPRTQSSLPQATPTRIPGLNSACLNGSMYQKSTGRCSNNLGCTAVYFNTSANNQNSCTTSPIGNVVYVNDKTNCRIISQDEKRQRGMDTTDDSVNTPCYADAMDPVGKTQLDCIHQNVNTPANIKKCLETAAQPTTVSQPTAAPTTATAVPTSVYIAPSSGPTPPPGSMIEACASSTRKLNDRCSYNFANSRAWFYTLDAVCTAAQKSSAKLDTNPQTCYKTDYSCPSSYQGKQLPARNGQQECALPTPVPGA